ncbi:RidA family protein [Roseomonas sp. BN140053]|uniref:RidA family protein n=1 Tax=Roseomonas sp. BN140053 TaxID=3391898 RepID=UPI0039E90FC9
MSLPSSIETSQEKLPVTAMQVARPPTPAGHRQLLPEGWPAPRGYAHGVLATGPTVFLGGQIGWNEHGIFAEGFVPQVRQALLNIRDVLREAGAGPEHLCRLTWYVVDVAEYRRSLKPLGAAYREVLGLNFPAMTLVGVTTLVEEKALVEIEATAVLPQP